MYQKGIYMKTNKYIEKMKRVSKETKIPYRIRDNTFHTSRFCFSPETGEATSYGWFRMLRNINGVLIMNTCGYSAQTGRHYRLLDSILYRLKIKPDIELYYRNGIHASFEEIIKDITNDLGVLKRYQKRPRIKAQTIDGLTKATRLLLAHIRAIKLFKKGQKREGLDIYQRAAVFGRDWDVRGLKDKLRQLENNDQDRKIQKIQHSDVKDSRAA